MNVFVLTGLALATLSIIFYVLLGYYNKKVPILNDAVVIFLGVGGIVSAIRIIGAVFSGQFAELPITDGRHSVWSLVPDDAIQIVLGGVALAWVSAQTIVGGFRGVLVKKSDTSYSDNLSKTSQTHVIGSSREGPDLGATLRTDLPTES
jgi:hypothetical protein